MAGAFEVPAQLATTMTGHTASVLCVRATATGTVELTTMS